MLRTTRSDIAAMAAEDVQRLVHELQVHQIELQLQNEELRETQVALAQSADRYSELYQFAPMGYLTLDHDNTILEANLMAASLIGVERQRLIHARFTDFLAPRIRMPGTCITTRSLHRKPIRRST